MKKWSARFGIRTQIIFVVLLGAIVTTAITLVIADTSIQSYGYSQFLNQESNNLKFVNLTLASRFGSSVSITSNNLLAFDDPVANSYLNQPYGILAANNNPDIVNYIHALLQDNQITIYQCANQNAQLILINGLLQCQVASTTFLANGQPISDSSQSIVNLTVLPQNVVQQMNIPVNAPNSFNTPPKTYFGSVAIQNVSYFAAYEPLIDPQHHLVGILSIAVPQTTVTSLINDVSLKLIISGAAVLVAGIILAIWLATAVSNTLKGSSNQIIGSCDQITKNAMQQTSGARQQVWAINAINQAIVDLQNFSNEVTGRTQYLANITGETYNRRGEMSPAQYEAVLAFMSNQSRSINSYAQQQNNTIDRMSKAMQAVIEIADQVVDSSQDTQNNADQLNEVVLQLNQLVKGLNKKTAAPNPAPNAQVRKTPEKRSGKGMLNGPISQSQQHGDSFGQSQLNAPRSGGSRSSGIPAMRSSAPVQPGIRSGNNSLPNQRRNTK